MNAPKMIKLDPPMVPRVVEDLFIEKSTTEQLSATPEKEPFCKNCGGIKSAHIVGVFGLRCLPNCDSWFVERIDPHPTPPSPSETRMTDPTDVISNLRGRLAEAVATAKPVVLSWEDTKAILDWHDTFIRDTVSPLFWERDALRNQLLTPPKCTDPHCSCIESHPPRIET